MQRSTSIYSGFAGLILASVALNAAGNGLSANADHASWARWQGRIAVASTSWNAGFVALNPAGLKVDGIGLLGDYYFSESLVGHGSTGGFRTTGGLYHGSRSQMPGIRPMVPGYESGGLVERYVLSPSHAGGDASVDSATLPYFGIGYTGVSLKHGWSINADLGMLAVQPNQGLKVGQAVGGARSLDDLLRDLRIEPIFRLGVSYSF